MLTWWGVSPRAAGATWCRQLWGKAESQPARQGRGKGRTDPPWAGFQLVPLLLGVKREGQRKAGGVRILISSSRVANGCCLREATAAPLGKEARLSHFRGWPREDDALVSLVISAEQAAPHLAGFVCSAGGRGSLPCVKGLRSARLPRAGLRDAGKRTPLVLLRGLTHVCPGRKHQLRAVGFRSGSFEHPQPLQVGTAPHGPQHQAETTRRSAPCP